MFRRDPTNDKIENQDQEVGNQARQSEVPSVELEYDEQHATQKGSIISKRT